MAATLAHANRRPGGPPVGATGLGTWSGADHLDLDAAVRSLLCCGQPLEQAALD